MVSEVITITWWLVKLLVPLKITKHVFLAANVRETVVTNANCAVFKAFPFFQQYHS